MEGIENHHVIINIIQTNQLQRDLNILPLNPSVINIIIPNDFLNEEENFYNRAKSVLKSFKRKLFQWMEDPRVRNCLIRILTRTLGLAVDSVMLDVLNRSPAVGLQIYTSIKDELMSWYSSGGHAEAADGLA